MVGDIHHVYKYNYGKTHGGHDMKWITNLFKKPEEVVPVVEPEVKARISRKAKLSEKELATANKEPYIKVLDTQIDPKNPANGYFELDWNSYFIDELRKSGYNANTEEEIIDKWFKALCQNVIAEDDNNREIRIV